ncbi:uncharacterized protein si:ch211-67f13.7 [Danio aesculapii]|uniref:uncharacterized protein si:ch211-67f13.7 n=1 Tax=Danio aesculapii TaxID=1142201 RepID=UPI0024BF109F|nr:uncharacterized protein si:ch211-67f13.7 [Danio aesculapii]
MNRITRALLGSILVIFFSPTLNSGSFGLDERVGHPQTRPVSGKLLVRDSFTSRRPVPVLRIRGRTPVGVPPGEDYLPKLNLLSDVSVTCSSTGFVLRVNKRFYGFSAMSEELTLGETCKSNGVLEPNSELLFTYALTDCQGKKQEFPDYVVYKYVLHYLPRDRNTHRHHLRVNVGVECRYTRDFLKPTWQTPLRKIIRGRSGDDFSIQLMDDTWSSPVRSAVFVLGQKVNVQLSTRHHYTGVKLFVNSCYATTVNTMSQTNKYNIIDNYGCLRESQINPGAARYHFSRADNVVLFSFGAFQFIESPDAQVSLHCELSVSAGGPNSMLKSCFYSHENTRWISLFGPDSVCDCCESVCNQTKTKRITYEGSVSSDEVIFSDPVTPPLSLNSTPITHRNEDVIWFKASLAKEPQTSHTHEDFVATVTLISSKEDYEEPQHKSHNKVKLVEEDEEKHGDVEILMSVSESFVGSEKTDLDLTEEFEGSSLGWSEDRNIQDVIQLPSYWPKKAQMEEKASQEHKGFMKMPSMVNEIMGESLQIDESALGDTQARDEVLPSYFSKEKNEEDEKMKEGLGFLLSAVSDELVEQGVVKKLDFTQDSHEYYFSDGV